MYLTTSKLYVVIFLSILGIIYILINLHNLYYEFKNKLNTRDIPKTDLVITDDKNHISAFVSLVNKEIDETELNEINKTLMDHHGYRIYYARK